MLTGSGVGLSQEELLDTLWLARALDGPAEALPLRREATPHTVPPPTTTAAPQRRRRRPGQSSRRADLFGGDRPSGPREPTQTPEPLPENPQHAGEPLPTGARAMPVQVPDVKALTAELLVGRALRPLKQTRPSTSRVEFDEQATVHALAETGLPDIVMRPAPERWLDLALVVDDGTSMVLWQRLAAELQALLRRAGAFRALHAYGLHTRGNDLRLSARPFVREAQQMPLSRLGDPTGRTLVLVVSDGVGRAWRDGRMHHALGQWARHGPTAVFHALPRRMWEGSGLRAQRWKVSSGRRGSANADWLVTDPLLPPEVAHFTGVPVPVLEATPGSLATWVNLVASPAASATLPLLAAPRTGERRPADTDLPRLRRFHAAATPEAYRLASHLAGLAPLSLPVMRLVQASIPWAETAHLAEVFLGGLMRPLPAAPGKPLPPQHQLFDFEPDAGETLINAVPLADLVQTARRVGEQLEQLTGRSADFPAWLAHPEGIDRIPTSTRAFATVGPRLASRFGVGSLERRTGTVWWPLRPADPWRVGAYTLHARGAGSGQRQRFLGRDPNGTEVVVITGPAGQRDLFRAEADALRQLGERCAPRLIAVSPDEAQSPWIAETHPVMRDGSPAAPLSDLLARDGLQPDAALELALRLCEAVSVSHHAGLCHGDLSSDSVQCLGRTVLITDWFASRPARGPRDVERDIDALGTILSKLTAFVPDDLGELGALIEACDPRHPAPTPSAHTLMEAFSARLGLRQDDGLLVQDMDHTDLRRLIRTAVATSHRVAVVGLSGAVGKSTTAALLASAFAETRTDLTVVVDTDPGRGTLGFRVNANTGQGMTAMVAREDAGRYEGAAPFVSRMASGAYVLTDLIGRRGPGPEAVRRVLRRLRDTYAIVITDSHSDVPHTDLAAVLPQADQLVLVVDSLDSLLSRAGREAFELLRANAPGDLLRRCIVVVSAAPPSGPGVDRPPAAGVLPRPFELRDLCRGIVSIGHDPHLVNGAEAGLSGLRESNRHAYMCLAALVAQSFAT